VKVLAVTDWASNFETHETRKLRRLLWVPMPNKHDGDGYTELVDHEDGAAHLGAWLAIVQVASKCEPRGTLARSGGRPHDAGTISRQTRIPLEMVRKAIGRLLGIGWLEWKEIPGPEPEPEAADASNSQPVNGPPEHRENVPEDRESLPVISREGPAEWKGREGKGREEEAPQAAPSVPVMEPPVQKGPRPPKRETFQPPTPDEVEEYARSLGAPDFDGVAFCAYYATRGWVPSGSRAPMKKWRAAVVTWLRRNR